MKILKFIFNEIFYNGHLQTWSSLAIILFSGLIFDIKITWDLLIIIYIAFYLIYLHDRYRDIDIDTLTNPTRSQHIKKIYNFIPAIIIIGVPILLFFAYYFNAKFYFLITIIFIITLGFLYPIYFKKITENIFIFKNIYIAFVASLLIILPFIYYSISPPNKLLLLFILLFIFIRGLLMQIFLDLKDIEGDKQKKLKTLAILLGEDRVFIFLKFSFIASALFLPIFYFVLPNIFPSSIIFLLVLIPLNFYYIKLAKNNYPIGFILISGEFIPLPILIFIGEYIFNK